MDDLEFRKSAIINPENQNPDFLKKIQQSHANSRFVSDQLEFNHKLIRSLHITTPENLSDRILLNQQLSQHQSQHQHKRFIFFTGIAAALVAVSLTLNWMLPKTANNLLLQQQLIQHYHQDTHALDVTMNVPKNSIDTLLASYGGKLAGPIGQVTFLGHCIIGEQTGIHMVLNTVNGKVTIMLLPAQLVDQSHLFSELQLNAIIYPSQKGSIAIFAEQPEAIVQTRQQLDRNLNWII